MTEEERYSLPTYTDYTIDPALSGEKVMLLTAVGIIASVYGVDEQTAWDYVRRYAVITAQKHGYDASTRR